MENILDIIAVSDTHGYLPKIETPFDGGDVSPAHEILR